MAKKNEKYLLKQTIHLGYLKETFSKGTEFVVNRSKGIVEVDGKVYKDLRDVDICIRNGFFVEASLENKKSLKKTVDVTAPKPLPKEETEPAPKMKVIRSDADLMEKEIDISYTKKAKEETKKDNDLTVLHEKEVEDIRGIKVVRKVADVEDYQEIIGDPSGELGMSDAKVVAKISKDGGIEKVSTEKEPANDVAKKTTAKRGRPKGSKKKAVTALKNRKAEIAKNRKKVKSESKS